MCWANSERCTGNQSIDPPRSTSATLCVSELRELLQGALPGLGDEAVIPELLPDSWSSPERQRAAWPA